MTLGSVAVGVRPFQVIAAPDSRHVYSIDHDSYTVTVVDRQPAAGLETSYGNAGLIECASVFPYMFPRDFGQLLKYALNQSPHVRYRFVDLPEFLPWLLRYYLASSPQVEGVSGEYFYECKPTTPTAEARNDEDALRLWEISEEIAG